jgi:hypothetical protein
MLLTLFLSGSYANADCISGDCANGKGTFTWENNDKYEGEWKTSQWDGQGTFIWSSGDKYVGLCKKGEMNG